MVKRARITIIEEREHQGAGGRSARQAEKAMRGWAETKLARSCVVCVRLPHQKTFASASPPVVLHSHLQHELFAVSCFAESTLPCLEERCACVCVLVRIQYGRSQ